MLRTDHPQREGKGELSTADNRQGKKHADKLRPALGAAPADPICRPAAGAGSPAILTAQAMATVTGGSFESPGSAENTADEVTGGNEMRTAAADGNAEYGAGKCFLRCLHQPGRGGGRQNRYGKTDQRTIGFSLCEVSFRHGVYESKRQDRYGPVISSQTSRPSSVNTGTRAVQRAATHQSCPQAAFYGMMKNGR